VRRDRALNGGEDFVISRSSARTFIALLGQSNAQGVGLVGDLTGSNVALSASYAAVRYAAKVDGNTDPPVFDTFATQDLAPIFFSAATRLGVEITMGRELDRSYPNKWAIGKFALGSTSLYTNWAADGTYPTGQTRLAEQAFQWVQARMAELGCSRVVFVWIQGEADAGASVSANAYQAKLGALVTLSRTYFAGAPWVIGKLNADFVNAASGAGTYTSTVRAAEVAYVASDANSLLVDMDGTTPSADHTHYTADGYCTVGYLYAKAVGQILSSRLRPQASFTSSPVLLSVTFTDTSIARDGAIVSWAWNFGDGTTSTSQNPTKSYATGGTYAVSLSVVDANGKSDSTTANVTVTAASWTNDATSGKAVPQTVAEWNAIISAAGLSAGAPSAIWLMQDASGNAVDVTGTFPLTASGTGLSYQNAVSGWSAKAINFTDNGTNALTTTSASLPDASTGDYMLVMWIATTLAGLREIVQIGTPAASALRAETTATPRLQLVNGTTTVGTTNPIGATVYPLVLQGSATLSAQALYTAGEKIVGTYAARAGKSFILGNSARTSAQMSILYAAMFTGTAAQRTSAQIKTLLTQMGVTGIPWS
jgi:PKD repeat protein